MDIRFEVDIGTRIESAMYAMYDGRRLCQPPTKTAIMSSVNAISSDWCAMSCALDAMIELAESIFDANPRRREVAIPVNLDVREVERIGSQDP